jgi:hypothetical protein
MREIGRDHAFASPTSSAFVPGQGYVSIGPPPMPAACVHQEHHCCPSPTANDGSIHELWSPDKHKVFKMAWRRETKTWMGLQLGQGNRLGFTSAYLAAHGWTYKGPA